MLEFGEELAGKQIPLFSSPKLKSRKWPPLIDKEVDKELVLDHWTLKKIYFIFKIYYYFEFGWVEHTEWNVISCIFHW